MFKVLLDDVLDVVVEVMCASASRIRALIIPIKLVSPTDRNDCFLAFFVYRPSADHMLVGVRLCGDRSPALDELDAWTLISEKQGTWKDDAIHDFLANTAKSAGAPVDNVEVYFPSPPYIIPVKKVEIIPTRKGNAIKVGLLPSFRKSTK